MNPQRQNRPIFWLRDGGHTGALFRSIAWCHHPLGDSELWPASLKNVLRIIFAAHHPMLVWWGPELYQFYNDACLSSLTAGKHPQAMGQRGIDCWPEHWPIIKPQIDEVLSGRGSIWREDQLLPTVRGGRLEEGCWNYGYSPVFQDDGSIGGILVLCMETTAKVRATRALEVAQKAREDAERANEYKSYFLANMSHEIRTPLGALLGFAHLLRDQQLSEAERLHYCEILCRNGENLSVIINDILDLTKVEAGFLSFEYEAVDTRQLLEDVLTLEQLKASEKNLTLVSSLGATAPKSITSDPTRMTQVLLNLLGNAIKFTAEGSIEVRVSGGLTSEGRELLIFDIKDSGIGIPAEQRDQVFEMFVQGDGNMTRRFGGTGLGLALSRRLARSLGGDVSLLESREGEGSTFRFSVASQPEKAGSQTLSPSGIGRTQLEAPESIAGVKVLVVDDSKDNGLLISRFLQRKGALVERAEDGQSACEKALQSDYHLLLMDIQMPVMDGFTAATRLRTSGFEKPIIALTAHAMGGIKQRCIDAGYTDHLSKPIDFGRLLAAVAYYSGREITKA